jgi:hypothetical protein
MDGAMAERTCRICGRVDPPGRYLTQGRCRMCQMYWRRHGVDRPRHLARPAATLRPCSHCAQLTATARRGRCNACYKHWRVHGTERPLGPRPPRPCQTCGQLVQQFHRGRCNPCYQYWYRHGRERPARLWERHDG